MRDTQMPHAPAVVEGSRTQSACLSVSYIPSAVALALATPLALAVRSTAARTAHNCRSSTPRSSATAMARSARAQGSYDAEIGDKGPKAINVQLV